MGTYLLEINLISAQGLKLPSATRRRLETYAVGWVDAAHKLRTRIDRVGGENPTWNDKFIFRVDAAFLSGETSAVSVEIYAVGFLKDPLIGTVRFLFGNCLNLSLGAAGASSSGNTGFGVPAFAAVQIRRPSGRFHGVLNIGATVMSGSDFATALHDQSAIGYQDLMGEGHRSRNRRRKDTKIEENEQSSGDCTSDGVISSCSSSPASTKSAVLKDWNARKQDLAGKKDRSGAKEALLCGLKKFQRKIHLSPSDQNLQLRIGSSDDENRKPEI